MPKIDQNSLEHPDVTEQPLPDRFVDDGWDHQVGKKSHQVHDWHPSGARGVCRCMCNFFAREAYVAKLCLFKMHKSGWWFQMVFYFHPYLGT